MPSRDLALSRPEVQVPPFSVATWPPAPQTHGYTPNSAVPGTANGIMSGLAALIFSPAATMSSQVFGASMPSSLKTSAR